MNAYIVLIDIPGDIDPYPLLVTTDSNKAITVRDQVENRWKERGEMRSVWIYTHEFKDDVMFDYDWLLDEDEDSEDELDENCE